MSLDAIRKRAEKRLEEIRSQHRRCGWDGLGVTFAVSSTPAQVDRYHLLTRAFWAEEQAEQLVNIAAENRATVDTLETLVKVAAAAKALYALGANKVNAAAPEWLALRESLQLLEGGEG